MTRKTAPNFPIVERAAQDRADLIIAEFVAAHPDALKRETALDLAAAMALAGLERFHRWREKGPQDTGAWKAVVTAGVEEKGRELLGDCERDDSSRNSRPARFSLDESDLWDHATRIAWKLVRYLGLPTAVAQDLVADAVERAVVRFVESFDPERSKRATWLWLQVNVALRTGYREAWRWKEIAEGDADELNRATTASFGRQLEESEDPVGELILYNEEAAHFKDALNTITEYVKTALPDRAANAYLLRLQHQMFPVTKTARYTDAENVAYRYARQRIVERFGDLDALLDLPSDDDRPTRTVGRR